ncbi:MAG: DUF2807 domain-containing protein [Muribaculaceae bacterium]|nr:DUF2807 domain-containing protein [Muribaculaceae bacterium]
MNRLLSKITLAAAIIASAVTQSNAKDITANLKQDLKRLDSSEIEEIRLNELTVQGNMADDLAATTTTTRTVNVKSAFKGLEVSGLVSVELKQGRNTKVEIVAAPEDIDKTVVEVGKSVLNIYNSNLSNSNNRKILVKVTMPEINSIEFSGVTSLKVLTDLQCDKLEVEGMGATSMTFQGISCKNLELEMSGAANCHIAKVDVTKCDMDFSGAANVTVDHTTGSDIEIESSGAALTKVYDINCNNLDCEASGASNVHLTGKCTNLKAEASGAANLNFKNKLTVSGSKSTQLFGAANIN